VIFAKVSAPEVASSAPLMAVIKHMLKVRREVMEGRVTDSEARAAVSDATLRAVVETGGTTPAPSSASAAAATRPPAEEEPRIVELD